MTDAGGQKAPIAADVETPANFLAGQGKALRGTKDVDVALADILAEHLLTATPAVDAVTKAKDAILELAGERAKPPSSEVTDG